MADDQKPGFTLPSPGTPSDSSGKASTVVTSPPPTVPDVAVDTGSRDILVAGGILVVLIVAFVFAKNAYANALVGKKIAPRSANAAGWWLFILLTSLATVAVLGAVNQSRFLTLMALLPLAFVTLLSLALTVTFSRRR